MKVCLVNPQDSVCQDGCWDEPLGLLYIAASLEKRGVPVEVLDLNFYKDWQKALEETDAEVYGVYVSSSLLASALKVCACLKVVKPNALLVAGGPHATVQSTDLTEHFDYVVVGEGERAIFEVLNNDYPNKIVKCPDVQDLDSLPYPSRHLVAKYSYHRRIREQPSFGLLTSRGCPGQCVFCSKVWGNTVRYRTPENVLEEVKECIDKYGVKAFSIRDDTFTLNKPRLTKILDGFKQLGITYRCLTRVDQIDRETLISMKESGCVEINHGVESGNQTILNNLRKGTTVEQNAEAIDTAKEIGLKVKVAVIVGSPGETWKTIRQTEQFIKAHTPNQIMVCTFTPYPGSSVWSNPERYGIKILSRDISSYQALGPGMSGKCVCETEAMNASELERAHDYLVSQFRKWGIIY